METPARASAKSSKQLHYFLTCLVLLVLVPAVCSARDVQIRGFVTDVVSPTSFQIDDYKITREPNLKIGIERNDSRDALTTENPDQIRVGMDVEVGGEINQALELKAKYIKVFAEEAKKLEQTALLTKPPALEKTEEGWKGTLFADGQRIVIEDSTTVTIKMSEAERKQLRSDNAAFITRRPLRADDVVAVDDFVSYEGVRQKDGTVLAKKIEFQSGKPDPREEEMWRKLTPSIEKQPDYAAGVPGELKIGRRKFKIVPNKEAQDYISALGQKLIPAHQKELPDKSPLKIPFKFYVVQDKDDEALSFPNGLVLVNSGAFDTWENEAQLAFLLSHAIKQILEKHGWRLSQYHKSVLFALQAGGIAGMGLQGMLVSPMLTAGSDVGSAVQAGYMRSLENQADRVALQQMLNAGYDIRQAAKAWRVYGFRHPEDPKPGLWDTRDKTRTRRGFIMAEIRNNYSETDYSKLMTTSPEYQEVATLIKELAKNKKAARTKGEH